MTVDTRLPKKNCEKCSLLGVQSPLKLFQLNDDEAVLMCKNVECTFMSSPCWEDLVVKRNLSKLSSGPRSRKTALARKAQSVCSVAQSDKPNIPTTKSVASVAANFRLHSRTPVEEDHRSPTPAKQSKFEEDKETLVPIAPFLCGHAHSFAPFKTKRFDKELLSKPTLSPPSYSAAAHIARPLPIGSVRNQSSSAGKNRRQGSLESDSISSGSLDSRPSSPSFAANVSSSINGNQVKKLVVPPETLAKIIDGTLQIKIVKSNKSKPANVTDVPLVPDSSQVFPSLTSERTVTNESVTPTFIHHRPIFESDSENSSSSSHIQAINSIIQSKGVGALDISCLNPVSFGSSLPSPDSFGTSAQANLWVPINSETNVNSLGGHLPARQSVVCSETVLPCVSETSPQNIEKRCLNMLLDAPVFDM